MPRRTDDFFAKPRSWSEWKHRILLKYSRMWAYKLSSKHTELAFIDACAGEGIYADGSEGSPVIAAKWNDDPGLIRNNTRLVVHAFEESPDSAARLRQALGPWVERGLARIYETSFEHELPALLARTRGMPTLIFIDPYGINSLTVDLLQPLLDDRERRSTEILFRVDPGLFPRMAGWIPKKNRDQKGERTAASFREKLKHYNIDVDQLEKDIESEGPWAAPGGSALLSTYLDVFEQRFKYVQIIPIRPTYWAAAKYVLVHGTDSPHGAALINDAVSTTEDSLFQHTLTAKDEATGQGTFFGPPAREPRARIEDAERAVVEYLESVKEASFIDVRATLAKRLGPDLREKHHKRATRNLVDAGRIRQLGTGPLDDHTVLTIDAAEDGITPRR